VGVLLAFGVSAAEAEVIFDWATVGNAGNAGEVQSQGTFGAVSYEYRIATTEVTNAQYAEFLNAVDATGTNPNAVYNTSMGGDARGGISFDAGAAAGSKYTTKTNMADKPVNYVSFLDAMRFVNWLDNGQGSGDTESGVYAVNNGLTETRSVNASYFIPSEDEWYKAAYHQPAAQGGDSDDYWLYPTASNTAPTVATATSTGDIANPGTNVANYFDGADWNSQDGNVTTVGSAGSGSESESFYGTSDQGGNVGEWNEAVIGSSRGLRGGSWDDFAGNQQAST
jgi:formylglycine-generating enzyme required for sulfatase activity